MTLARRALAAALALVGLTGLADRSKARLPVLRHLVFDASDRVQGDVDLRLRTYFGFQDGYEHVPQSSRHGTVTVDVVAATGDGGLVVDVTERADDGQSVPAMRVAITRRDLTATDDAHLTEEERLILHLLARDVIEPTTVAAGVAWDERVRENGVRLDIRYDVTAVDTATKVLDVTMAGSVVESRGGGIDVATSGSMRYDLGLLVPLACTMHTVASTDREYGIAQATSDVVVSLRSDSFAKS